MGDWQNTKPDVTNKISEIPGLLQQNWDAIEDILNIEHYGPASGTGAASGTHKLGIVSTIFKGTTVQIAALTPVSGAMALDTTLGILEEYDGVAWNRIGYNYWSRIRAYRSTTIVVTAGASAQTLIYDTENYDTLSEYNNTTGLFTASSSGTYLIAAQLTVVASSSILNSGITSATGNVAVTWTPSGNANNWQNINQYPTPDDTKFNTSHTSGQTDVVSGTLPAVQVGSTGIAITVAFRSRARGCPCNSTCYGYSGSCGCNAACYQQNCSCNNTCYAQG
jgi:hypothetical protein